MRSRLKDLKKLISTVEQFPSATWAASATHPETESASWSWCWARCRARTWRLRCSPPARNLGSQASEIPLGSPDLPGPRWPPSEAHSSPANPACRSPVGSDVKWKHINFGSVIKTSRYIYLTFSSRFAFASSSAVVFFPSPSLSSKKKILSFKLKFSFFISLKLSS